MKNLATAILLLVTIFSFAQEKEANRYYNAGYYKEASLLFENILTDEDDDTFKTRKKLANCYFKLRDLDNSKKHYKILIDNNVLDSITLIRYIELNRNFCDYDATKGYVDLFALNFLQCETCGDLEDNLRLKKIYWPENNQDINYGIDLKRLPNFPNNKIGMGYTFKNNTLLIAGSHLDSAKGKTTFYDLATVSSSDDYKQATHLTIPDYNNYYRAYPSYHMESKTLYFTSNGSDETKFKAKKSEKEGYSKDGKNTLQIFVTSEVDGIYSSPERLPFCDYMNNYTHPSISEDGSKLFFVSDRDGGRGGYDVYYVLKSEEGWGEPINCGEFVNSPFDELTPSQSGDSLFFSSYGNNGYGGSDIFLAVMNESMTYESSENLGLPVNSCKDDFSFVFSPTREFGYLTSNRDSKMGSEDFVYRVLFPEEEYLVVNEENNEPIADVLVVVKNGGERELTTNEDGIWVDRISDNTAMNVIFDSPWYETKRIVAEKNGAKDVKEVKLKPIVIFGQVIDAITNKTMADVNVKLYMKNDDGSWSLVEQKRTDDAGNWKFFVRKDKDYKVEYDKENYVKDTVIIPAKKVDVDGFTDALDRMNPYELSLKPVAGNELKIENIYFDFDKATIREESYAIMDNIYKYLVRNADTRIELSAHTDCIGKDSYNLRLSKKRAQSCYNYLIEKGINKERITPVGYGEKKMINTDCAKQRNDDAYAQKNRRMEVKIL